jgi:hypothetical protein
MLPLLPPIVPLPLFILRPSQLALGIAIGWALRSRREAEQDRARPSEAW